MKKTIFVILAMLIASFILSSCNNDHSIITSTPDSKETTAFASTTTMSTSTSSKLDSETTPPPSDTAVSIPTGSELDPNVYYPFGEDYGRGDNIYRNEKLSQQTGYLGYRDSVKGSGEVSPTLLVNVLGNDYEIDYIETSSNIRNGQNWDIYVWYQNKKEGVKFYFDSKSNEFSGFFVSLPNKCGHLFNIGENFPKMTENDVVNWFEETFSYVVDFSQFDNTTVKYNPDETIAPYKYEIEWHIEESGYITNRWVKTSVLYDGTVLCFRFYKGVEQTDIKFNITEEQKEQEIHNILEQQLKTESTRYSKEFKKQEGLQEVIVEQDGKLYLLVTLNANFNVIDDSHKHKNWYAKTDVLIPLERYLVN